jgi:hypothetical protein
MKVNYVKEKKLARASQQWTTLSQPAIVPGLVDDPSNPKLLPYHECIKSCRFFYRRDPIASTVVNRIAEISATRLVNKRSPLLSNGDVPDDVMEVYNVVAKRIQPYVKLIILSYLLDGMAIPQYELVKYMGNRVSEKLGRTRYVLPEGLWLRSAEHIELQPTLFGGVPQAYLRIPPDDVTFIQNEGIWANGLIDREAYDNLVKQFPDYVALVKQGVYLVPFRGYVIYRNLLPGNRYPIPFLEAAIDPLNHKRYLKQMDRAVASRAIEAFRHVKVGNDEYPADDEDIQATQDALNQKSAVDRVYNLFTNHTIEIEWVVPPLDTLLDDTKYSEANADIFFALGFPRILTVGETEKSNSADNKIAALGVLSSMQHIQKDILQWVEHMYKDIALENAFTRIPTPTFSPINIADIAQLLQYARDMLELEVLSKDTVAGLYGADYDTERMQQEYEASLEPLREEPEQVVPNNAPQEETQPEENL